MGKCFSLCNNITRNIAHVPIDDKLLFGYYCAIVYFFRCDIFRLYGTSVVCLCFERFCTFMLGENTTASAIVIGSSSMSRNTVGYDSKVSHGRKI